jgi:hypothetical protein
MKKSPFLFWNPKPMKKSNSKSIFSPKFIQPVKLSQYPARSRKEIRLIDRNPWGDCDKDKVLNIFDCKPLNRKKHSKMLRREIAERVFGASYYSGLPPPRFDKEKLKSLTPEQQRTFKSATKAMGPMLIQGRKSRVRESVKDINEGYKELIRGMNVHGEKPRYKPYPKFRKGTYKTITEADIVKILEKNPDLIKEAEKVEWEMLPTELSLHGGVGGDYGESYGYNPEKDRMIRIAEAMTKKQNLPHTIKHELSHHKQFEEGNTWTKLQTIDEAQALEDYNKKMMEKYGPNFSPYQKLPWKHRPVEIDAERRANEPFARDIAKLEGEKPEVLQQLDTEYVEEQPSEEIIEVEPIQEEENY